MSRATVAADAIAASRRARGLALIRDALDDRDALAFVHAGSDADGTYLGGPVAVVTSDDAIVLRESTVNPRPRDDASPVAVRTVDDPVASVVPTVNEHIAGRGTVLTPRSVRHDAALFLERAGFDVASTTALADARARKTPAEGDALRELGEAGTAGVEAVADRLAGARVDDGGLVDGVDGQPLTGQGLTDTLRVELARNGADAADSRVWSVDGPALTAGRPIVVSCRPRRHGLRLQAAWTFVVDGDGGWERRASLALEHAHRAGRDRIAAALDGEDETAGSVVSEVRAELTAYGFEATTVAVHGVGCASRERPRGGDAVETGQAVVVRATVERTDDETTTEARRTDRLARAETLLLGDSVERLAPMPTSLSPGRR